MPVVEPTVAIAVLLLLHKPPDTELDSIVVVPAHKAVVPSIGPGAVLTVTVVVVSQPVANLYVIIAVPVATPVTIPEDDPTVAMPVALLLHVPPGTELPNGLVNPTHTLILPVITPGDGLTDTVVVRTQPAPSE